MAAKVQRPLVIGVDVGGTNTDAVLLDTSQPGTSAVLSCHKSPTTPDVTDGVEAVLKALLSKPWSISEESSSGSPVIPSTPDPKSVTALAIGTTHFLNAIIQHDAALLSRVAVIRLGSYGFLDGALPFADWPLALRGTIEAYSAVVPGGVNIDGRLIAPLDESSLREQARKLYNLGLRNIVIVGMGSPMDRDFNQEAEAKDHILSELNALDASYAASVNIVLSHTVAGSGLLARENAAILNASISTFARRTIHSFLRAMGRVGLQCPLYLTSNAGHLLPFKQAILFPIRIFSSGPTNSMRGAAFLAGQDLLRAQSEGRSFVVVDVGGTTSDVGALMPNGYPRLSKTHTDLAGVKVNLDMPSVESIGLGGGSIIRILGETPDSIKASVGPDSVGYALTTKALCFGGTTTTATDVVIAHSRGNSSEPSIGDPNLINLSPEVIAASQGRIKQMFESLIDRIKLSDDDCTVILVGGGAFLCPSQLRGVNRVIRCEHAGVANAIGAALAKIHGSAEALVDADDVQAGIVRVTEAAVAGAVAKGGVAQDVTVLNETVQWVPYVDGKRLVHIGVACSVDHARVYSEMIQSSAQGDLISGLDYKADTVDESLKSTAEKSTPTAYLASEQDVDILTYRPEISPSGEWVISPTDLKFIEIGCYILGCGGGGSPYSTYLNLLELLRQGERIVIVSPDSLPDEAVLPPVAAIGTPAVGLERISSDAVFHAIKRLAQELGGAEATHMLATEIGGMNGLATLRWAAKRYCNVPVVDGDLMGRAYPNFEMVSQYVSAETINELLPVAICSGDGRDGIIPAGQTDEISAGKEIRRVCAEFGFAAGAAGNPLSGAKFRSAGIPNTFSLAWRLGRVVRSAQVNSTLGTVTDAIVAEVGGPTSARRVFTGKVRGVETKITETGHSLGQVIIEKLGEDEVEMEADRGLQGDEWSEVRVPFMNENLAVVTKGSHGEEKILATVPDLIFLLDVSSGEAIGVQEYRYGVKVVVMIMAPHPVWTTKRGLEVAGPKVFNLPHEYVSTLVYHKPRSVIEEFAPVVAKS
ncbi:hypothetical protein jhhlp_007910 [Lomentospora prolificans]|uniref:Hydantoinase A/oxoprolinase domain-containing protein n=1 Tax=Lomentospora prolificans TaxID=41688 RepID=A0A2N3N0W7_9PEZI|nr:hypothetical protein jhhlp_007910 [Lomentospora prolificans]